MKFHLFKNIIRGAFQERLTYIARKVKRDSEKGKELGIPILGLPLPGGIFSHASFNIILRMEFSTNRSAGLIFSSFVARYKMRHISVTEIFFSSRE